MFLALFWSDTQKKIKHQVIVNIGTMNNVYRMIQECLIQKITILEQIYLRDVPEIDILLWGKFKSTKTTRVTDFDIHSAPCWGLPAILC
jgi:hypothetical protein